MKIFSSKAYHEGRFPRPFKYATNSSNGKIYIHLKTSNKKYSRTKAFLETLKLSYKIIASCRKPSNVRKEIKKNLRENWSAIFSGSRTVKKYAQAFMRARAHATID